MSGEEPAPQIAPVEFPQMVSSVKLPILKKGEYTLWSMRMEQYLTNTDYGLWQVIMNGDEPIQTTRDENGIETEVPPKTTQALLARQRERKAESILLLAITDEYQLRFHTIKDAKSLWAAIKSRFGGNVESKKMQKTVLKQQFENFSISNKEGLDKAYDRHSEENLFEPSFMKIDPHNFNAESYLIESLLNHDSLTISSSLKIDSLLYKFAGELTLLKSISPGINEIDCDPEEEIHFIKRLLYDNSSPQPPEEFISENSDAAFEFFSPSPIPVEDSDSLMEEIDLYFTSDDPMPPGIEEDDYDSEGDILILEELLENDSLSFSKNESFHFDIPSSSRPPAKPPDGENGIKW
nr:ribonuclease H-like domain-containing protein [Tanacetum cinerariifolium]